MSVLRTSSSFQLSLPRPDGRGYFISALRASDPVFLVIDHLASRTTYDKSETGRASEWQSLQVDSPKLLGIRRAQRGLFYLAVSAQSFADTNDCLS
jgi:hypothetical protein